ncbi:MAG: hypothetical protein ACOY0T_09470 [Myxococcota bacterium]
MAKQNVIEPGNAGNTPVSSGIHRAAERIGYTPSVEEPEAETEVDRSEEELDHLRSIVNAAELIFEHGGPVDKKPENVLIEALRTAGDDFALFGTDASAGDGTASSMAFRRAELRCELALALFEYRREFGFPEPAGKVVDAETGVVS